MLCQLDHYFFTTEETFFEKKKDVCLIPLGRIEIIKIVILNQANSLSSQILCLWQWEVPDASEEILETL